MLAILRQKGSNMVVFSTYLQFIKFYSDELTG